MYCTQDCTCSLCRELRGLKPTTKANNKNRLTKTSLAADNNMSEKKSKNLFKLKKDKDKDGKKGKGVLATNNDNFILCSRFLSDSPANMGMVVNGKPDIGHAFDGGARSMKKSLSYSELSGDSHNFPNFKYHLNRRDKFNHQSALNLANDPEKRVEKSQPTGGDPPGKHKVIIYFGDSIPNKGNNKQQRDEPAGGPKNLTHAQRLFEEMRLERNNSILQKERQLQNLSNEKYVKNFTDEISDKTVDDETTDNFMLQLKSVLEQKQRGVKEEKAIAQEDAVERSPKLRKPPPIPAPVPPEVVTVVQPEEPTPSQQPLPSYIESIVNGVINIKIEDNYQVASKLVAQLFDTSQATTATMASSNASTSNMGDNSNFYCNSDDGEDAGSFDWSFVQDWRTRPSGNVATFHNSSLGASNNNNNNNISNGNNLNNSTSNNNNGHLNQTISSNSNINQSSNNHVHSSSSNNSTFNSNHSNSLSPGTHHIVSSNPVMSTGQVITPAIATPALRCTKEVAARPMNDGGRHSNGLPRSPTVNGLPQPPTSGYYGPQHAASPMIPERDSNKFTAQPIGGNITKISQHRVAAPAKCTVQSIPVKSQPAMVSSGLQKIKDGQKVGVGPNGAKGAASTQAPAGSGMMHAESSASSKHHQQQMQQIQQMQQQHSLNSQKSSIVTRTHHHAAQAPSSNSKALQRVQECHSSSDENRSSGHASMSDTGHGSSSPGGNRSNGLGPLPEDRLAAGVTNRSARSRASTGHSRSRHRATPAKVPWAGGGLEDIKLAIQQLTMRSQTSTSTYSSLSAGSESSEPVRRLGRYSSLETVNTNVTSADEFVWVDSHNRLVELQHPPWSQHCVMRVIRSGRCREHCERISPEAIPRLGYLLQRALVRVAREIQRLSSGLGLCSKNEVAGAFKVVLCPALADSCIKACLRAAAMFAVPGDSALRQSKSSRAGLQLPVGRFHRWMADACLGRFVHEYSAVYLCAGMENLLEEILLQCLPTDSTVTLTATGLEHAIAGSGDLWGLLQPYAHLNAGRIASGALTMPRWASQSSIGSGSTNNSQPPHHNSNPSLEPCLLTTCVGSQGELKDLVQRAQQRSHHVVLSQGALRALFYFMRCSQLEHNDASGSNGSNVQELCYERAYVVLPPLVEWLRVASAHAEYRHANLIDKDDIMQSARLLLPGVDCPPRPIASEEDLPTKTGSLPGLNISQLSQSAQQLHGSISSGNSNGIASNLDDTNECGRRATLALAFRLMLTGRAELLVQALQLLPPGNRYDILNNNGLTALMIAAIRNDEIALLALLDAGADPNVEVPSTNNNNYHGIHSETQHWTAITFAACRGNYTATRILLERGAHVEGGARLSEDKCTLTPLQVAAGCGCVDIVTLLLAHGAHAFLSTQQKDSLCFSGTAQKGCYSAISVAAAHGQRVCLRKLLSHPLAPGSREVLSLEEMLAEGDSTTRAPIERSPETPPTLNKTQIKSLQEAMYHSAENNHLDITIELRALGVPWTLHCWMHALAAAHELRLDAVIDQLLQDFLQVCPDDYSQQFVSECLPLLFNIFRYSKKEGTTLLLADIFCTCFGWEPIKVIKEPVLQPVNGSRIDPKFVNNPELSDVTFRVEGRIFYGHKIVLVTASQRLQNMLSSKMNENNGTPTVQINDIRYHIFELVMQFLYSGGCNNLDVVPGDVLELMAAASFFQLDGLLRYTEARCAEMIDIDNVVAMYIHAKVYNAPKLMEYCQGFLLQNMVALLTYDDSVKRLLFAKKIPNHDVLSGLLATLQQRIKMRRNNSTAAANIQRPATVASNKIK